MADDLITSLWAIVHIALSPTINLWLNLNLRRPVMCFSYWQHIMVLEFPPDSTCSRDGSTGAPSSQFYISTHKKDTRNKFMEQMTDTFYLMTLYYPWNVV